MEPLQTRGSNRRKANPLQPQSSPVSVVFPFLQCSHCELIKTDCIETKTNARLDVKNVQYVKAADFLKHVKAEHPEKYDQLARKPVKVNEATQVNGNTEGFRCDKCPFATAKKPLMRSHVESHVPYEDRQKFECGTCHKLFSKATILKIHLQRMHFKIRRYKCPKCPSLNFNQIGTLSDHMALKHAKNIKNQFKCNLCNRRFLKRYMLNRHQRATHKALVGKISVETTNRNLKKSTKLGCFCGKVFLTKARLVMHKTKHHGNLAENPKLFHCPSPDCILAFTQRCNLIRHQKQKGHLRPEEIANLKFACSCGEKFFSYRGYSFHCEKHNCEKMEIGDF